MLPINKRVEYVPLEQFKVDFFSPRVDLGDLTSLQLSLQAFGQVFPIIATPHPEGMAVIGGARLVQAAKNLGWSHIQTLILDLEPLQAYRLTAFLNQHKPWTVEEEKHFISRLNAEYGLKPEQMAALLHKPRRWILKRMEV